jgi:hypothetical protein
MWYMCEISLSNRQWSQVTKQCLLLYRGPYVPILLTIMNTRSIEGNNTLCPPRLEFLIITVVRTSHL